MSKHKRITPVLKELHWISIEQQIKFTVAVLTYKSMNEMEPQYPTELLEVYKLARHLCSSSGYLLVVNCTNTKKFRNKSFLHAAAEI